MSTFLTILAVLALVYLMIAAGTAVWMYKGCDDDPFDRRTENDELSRAAGSGIAGLLWPLVLACWLFFRWK